MKIHIWVNTSDQKPTKAGYYAIKLYPSQEVGKKMFHEGRFHNDVMMIDGYHIEKYRWLKELTFWQYISRSIKKAFS